MEMLGILAVLAVIVYFSRPFLHDLFWGSSTQTQVLQSLPDWEALATEVTAPIRERQRRRLEARKAFPADMRHLVCGIGFTLDPVEKALDGEARELYLDAKYEVMSAHLAVRVPAPWAVEAIRTMQRRHHAGQTRRAAQVLKA